MLAVEMLQETENGFRWVDLVLTVIFLIHTFAFIYLYLKRRHFYTLLLVIAFPFLVFYYTLKCFQVDFTGMDWIRWTGIGIATVALILLLKEVIEKARLKRANPGSS